MNRIVNHIFNEIRFENTQSTTPVFDPDKPIRSTGDMRTWYTSKPCEYTKKSHINFCVFDSTWESFVAAEMDKSTNVAAWVKNDHIGFEIPYMYQGIVHKYYPDYLIKFNEERILILEVKGQETDQDRIKKDYLNEWITAVNEFGGFGKWESAFLEKPDEITEILNV